LFAVGGLSAKSGALLRWGETVGQLHSFSSALFPLRATDRQQEVNVSALHSQQSKEGRLHTKLILQTYVMKIFNFENETEDHERLESGSDTSGHHHKDCRNLY
jgi:hypothetical protein